MLGNLILTVEALLLLAGILALLFVVLMVIRFAVSPLEVISEYEELQEMIAARNKARKLTTKKKTPEEIMFDVELEEETNIHYYDKIDDGFGEREKIDTGDKGSRE